MNDDFAPFELAVKLKEKGFRERVKGYYKESKVLSVCNTPMNSNALDNEFSAPTISQVLKWLRKKYSIHISTKPHPCEDGIMWSYEIRKFNEYISFVVANKTGFIKEEQANIAGIEVVLDNLI